MKKILVSMTLLILTFLSGCGRTTTIIPVDTNANTPDDIMLSLVAYDSGTAGFSAVFTDVLVAPYTNQLQFDLTVDDPNRADAVYHVVILKASDPTEWVDWESFPMNTETTTRPITIYIQHLDDSVYEVAVYRSTAFDSSLEELGMPAAGFRFRIPDFDTRGRLGDRSMTTGAFVLSDGEDGFGTQFITITIADPDRILQSVRIVATDAAEDTVVFETTVAITDANRVGSLVTLIDLGLENLFQAGTVRVDVHGSGCSAGSCFTDVMLDTNSITPHQ